MKISDIVQDWLFDTPIFEMAHQRKRAIELVTNHQHQIAVHLIKHLHYDVSDETKNHWEAEINAWLGSIKGIKLKNGKRLSGDVYYRILFTEPLGETTDIIDLIDTIDNFYGMNHHGKIGSVQFLHERIEKILHTLSFDMANGKLKQIQYYLTEF